MELQIKQREIEKVASYIKVSAFFPNEKIDLMQQKIKLAKNLHRGNKQNLNILYNFIKNQNVKALARKDQKFG